MSQLTSMNVYPGEHGVLWLENEDHQWFLQILEAELIQVSHYFYDGRLASTPIHVVDTDFMKVALALRTLANLRQEPVHFQFLDQVQVLVIHPDPS